jgi:hypothetical protein
MGEKKPTADDGNDNQVHVLEVSENLIKTNSETARFEFLGSCCPLHLYAQEMTHNCSCQMKRDTAEEEDKHGCPLHCLNQGPEEDFLTETMTQHSESQGRKDVEDNGHADEDFPGSKVELIEVIVVQAYHDIIGNGERDGAGNGVI